MVGMKFVAAGAGILTPMLTLAKALCSGYAKTWLLKVLKVYQNKLMLLLLVLVFLYYTINSERGLSVDCWKGNIAGEQSSRFYGQAITIKSPDKTFLLHHLGKHRWREMNAKWGVDTTYRTQGRVEVSLDEEDLLT